MECFITNILFFLSFGGSSDCFQFSYFQSGNLAMSDERMLMLWWTGDLYLVRDALTAANLGLFVVACYGSLNYLEFL